jgi:hypothetical protein
VCEIWNVGQVKDGLLTFLVAALPPEEKNPLIKLLMDVSMSQETLLEDYVLLTNRFNIHRCSDYCLTNSCLYQYADTPKAGDKTFFKITLCS